VVFRIAASIEPQDREGQGGIDRALAFLRVYSQHRKCRPRLPHDAARVDGPERAFQIHRVTELRQGEIGEVPIESPPQMLLVTTN